VLRAVHCQVRGLKGSGEEVLDLGARFAANAVYICGQTFRISFRQISSLVVMLSGIGRVPEFRKARMAVPVSPSISVEVV
jgi:hypothetical protein